MINDAPEMYSIALLYIKFENLEKGTTIPLTEVIPYTNLKVEKNKITMTISGKVEVTDYTEFKERLEELLGEHDYGKITDWALQPDGEEATPQVLRFMNKYKM